MTTVGHDTNLIVANQSQLQRLPLMEEFESKGVSVTPQRRALIGVTQEAKHHPDTDALLDLARETGFSIPVSRLEVGGACRTCAEGERSETSGKAKTAKH
jgi:Fe2+ or Zn2+ uptake regulation protein